jgi:tetratricopeptide (TPR) repeat protein
MITLDATLAQSAEILERQGQAGPALRAVERRLKLSPRDPALWKTKGDLLLKLARPLAAVRAFEQSLRLKPGVTLTHIQVASIYSNLGVYAESLRHWFKATECNRELDQPRFEAGADFGRLGWFDLAMRMFGGLRTDDGHWLAEIAAVRGERNEVAARLLSRLKSRPRLEPFDEGVAFACVRDLVRLGRIGPAEALFAALSSRLSPAAKAELRFLLDRRRVWSGGGIKNPRAVWRDEALPASSLPLFAEGFYQEGQFEIAGEIIEHLAIEVAPPHVQELALSTHFALGDSERTLDLAKELMASRPEDTRPYQFALTTLLALDRVEPLNGPKHGDVRIPPVLFQFWDKSSIPADVAAVMNTWNDDSGELQRVVFDDQAAKNFIRDHYPEEHSRAFELCHHPAMKSDFIRLCYLHKLGGIYLDVDEACQDTPTALLRSISGLELALHLSSTIPYYTNNNIIGAVPGHPVIELALSEALRSIIEGSKNGGRPEVWTTTGPGVLTRNLVRYLLDALSNKRADAINGIGLLSSSLVVSLTALNNSLTYKSTAEGNWRLIKEPIAS